jgi:hypothetical protein
MVCRVERHVEEEAKKLLGWRESGGEQRLALVTVAKKMGHASLHEKPFTRREHAPLAIHHQLQLALFDNEFLVSVGMKVLPAGPCLHSADFNENIALKHTRTFVDVCENERLAVKGVTNPGACRRKRFHYFLPRLRSISRPRPRTARLEVSAMATVRAQAPANLHNLCAAPQVVAASADERQHPSRRRNAARPAWQVEFKRHPVRARVGQLTSRRRIREFCRK